MKEFISGEPMERLAVNILGPLPVTEKGNKYILVMSDCLLNGQKLQLYQTKNLKL